MCDLTLQRRSNNRTLLISSKGGCVNTTQPIATTTNLSVIRFYHCTQYNVNTMRCVISLHPTQNGKHSGGAGLCLGGGSSFSGFKQDPTWRSRLLVSLHQNCIFRDLMTADVNAPVAHLLIFIILSHPASIEVN